MSNFSRLSGVTKPSKTVVCRCHRCGGGGVVPPWGQCFRCGGNGRDPQDRDYGFPQDWSDEQCQQWLDRKAAVSEARRQANSAKRLAAAAAVFAQNLAACPALAPFREFVLFDSADIPKSRWPAIVRHATRWEATFIRDTERKAHRYALTEKQIAVCNAIVERVSERAAKAAAEAETLVDAPSGRCEITGEVVSVKEYESEYGVVTKILVSCQGYKVFGTAPRSIVADIERGDRVTITATIQPKERGFATYSRPTKASLTKTEPAAT